MISPIAHILGNGPSRKEFKNNPAGDIFGCNLSDPSIPLKATFIMDKVVIDHIHNHNMKLNFPVILPNGIRKLANQCPYPPVILDVMEKQLESGESTGHRAVLWCMNHGYSEIHMWGFDSMRKDSVESDTPQLIPEGIFTETNYKKWRITWKKLLEKGPDDCKVTIH